MDSCIFKGKASSRKSIGPFVHRFCALCSWYYLQALLSGRRLQQDGTA